MVIIRFDVRTVQLAGFGGPDSETTLALLSLRSNTQQFLYHCMNSITFLLTHPCRVRNADRVLSE